MHNAVSFCSLNQVYVLPKLIFSLKFLNYNQSHRTLKIFLSIFHESIADSITRYSSLIKIKFLPNSKINFFSFLLVKCSVFWFLPSWIWLFFVMFYIKYSKNIFWYDIPIIRYQLNLLLLGDVKIEKNGIK